MCDITLCTNKDCVKKNECYRFMAIPNEFQLYNPFIEMPCKHFMHIKGRPIRNKNDPEPVSEP